MKKIFLFILILLTACTSRVTVAPAEASATPLPMQTDTPTAVPTFTPTATEIPLASLPIEELAKMYLEEMVSSDEIINALSFEQQKEFSIRLNEIKNEQRGANPIIYTNEEDKEVYLDPKTLDYLLVDNGTTALEQTIPKYNPSAIDPQGFMWVYDREHEEWVKIEGSQDIKYDNPEDVDWSDSYTGPMEPEWVSEENGTFVEQHPEMSIPEFYMKKPYGTDFSMWPIFIINKDPDDILDFALPVYKPIGAILVQIPSQGYPFSTRSAFVTGKTPDLYTGNESNYTPLINGSYSFFRKWEERMLYYMVYPTEQKSRIIRSFPETNGEELTSKYQGFIPSSLTSQAITGKYDSDDLIIIFLDFLVKDGRK